MENSTDSDQTLRDAESDLGLHCLLRPVEYLVYGISFSCMSNNKYGKL